MKVPTENVPLVVAYAAAHHLNINNLLAFIDQATTTEK